MRIIKKYTIMFVPFNQDKVIRFNITNIGMFVVIGILFLLLSFTAISIFSDYSSLSLNENRLNNNYIKKTVGIFNDQFSKNRKNYHDLKKEIERFVRSYYPVFYDRYNIYKKIDGQKPSLLEEVNFLVHTVKQYSVFYKHLNRFFSKVPAIFPVVGGGKVTSRFGPRLDPFTVSLAFHSGVDIPKFPGTPIRATASGVVDFAGWTPGYGFVTKIKHSYGFMSFYAHQISMPLVKDGEDVRQGQIIGHVGSTGRSVGYHLHYEVRNNGSYVNPEPYLFLKKR